MRESSRGRQRQLRHPSCTMNVSTVHAGVRWALNYSPATGWANRPSQYLRGAFALVERISTSSQYEGRQSWTSFNNLLISDAATLGPNRKPCTSCCSHGDDQGPIQQQLCHHNRVKVLPRATIRKRGPPLSIYNVLSFVTSYMQSLSQYSFVIFPFGSQLAVCQLMQIPFQVLFFWVSPEFLYVNLSFSKYPLGLRVEGHCRMKCRSSCAVLFKEVYVLFGVGTNVVDTKSCHQNVAEEGIQEHLCERN